MITQADQDQIEIESAMVDVADGYLSHAEGRIKTVVARLTQERDTALSTQQELLKRLHDAHLDMREALDRWNAASTKRNEEIAFLQDERDTALQTAARLQQPITATVSPIHVEEDGTGPLVSTDLFVEGRGVALLVNVEAGHRFSWSLIIDGGTDLADKHRGTVGADVPSPPQRSTGEE